MKATIIILAIVALLATGFFFLVLPKIKRKKLAEGWSDMTRIGDGPPGITPEQITECLDRVSNKEIDVLIKYSKAMQAKDFATMGSMFKEVSPILKKAQLDNIFK